MADNVAITAGSGVTVATDDVGGVQYQRVKITDGTPDSDVHLKIAAEDAAHGSGDTGIMALAVRKDTATAVAADGDYIPLIVDASGRLWIHSTYLATIAGAVSGSEMQADIVTIARPGTVYAGQNTVASAGTQEALAGSQALVSGVLIKALHANTGWIYVGASGVDSATGIVLDAGESVFVDIDNLANVYIDSSVNGEGVSYIAT